MKGIRKPKHAYKTKTVVLGRLQTFNTTCNGRSYNHETYRQAIRDYVQRHQINFCLPANPNATLGICHMP